MVAKRALLVIFVLLIDGEAGAKRHRMPLPPAPAKRGRGRPVTYTDRLLLKALVIMIIRRLYTAYSLLAFLDQESELTQQLRELLTEQGRFPARRTWERRLAALPAHLPGLIAKRAHSAISHLGQHLVRLLLPWGQQNGAAAVDSTPLRAKGGVWHKKDREAGLVPHSTIDTEAHWSKSGYHG